LIAWLIGQTQNHERSSAKRWFAQFLPGDQLARTAGEVARMNG